MYVFSPLHRLPNPVRTPSLPSFSTPGRLLHPCRRLPLLLSGDRIRTCVLLPALTAILSAPALVAQEPDAAARKPDPAAVQHYSKGLELLQNRDFRNAAIALEQAVGTDSTYGDAHYALAKTCKTLNQFDRAVRAFEAADRHGVSSERARERIPAQLADVYKKSAVQSFKQKKFREAIGGFEKALEHSPGDGDADVFYLLGLCYNALRQDAEAARAFQDAIDADSSYVKAIKSLADLQRRQGKLGGAAGTYRRAVALDPAYTKAYLGLAKVQIDSEDLDGALATLNKAVEVDPGFLQGLCLIGQTLSRKGRWHEAIKPLRRALEVDSDYAEAHYRLAEAYYGTGDWKKALDAGLDATRRQRNYHAAEVVVADSYSKLGQVAEARTWYKKARQDSRFRDWCEQQLKELDRQQP